MPSTDRRTRGIEIGVNGIWNSTNDSAALMTLTPPGNSMLAANSDAVYGLPIPDATHPIVRTHAETGRKSLFISPRFVVGIDGTDDEEAQALLDELFEHQIRPEFRYRHTWRRGDLLMWDNSCLIHIGRGNIKPPGIRHMHRTMVLGAKC